MGWFNRQVKAELHGHRISVTYSGWNNGELKLFVDGEIEDSTEKQYFPSRNVPVLTGSLDHEGKKIVIEFFVKNMWYRKFKLCADGEFLAGDQF